jgi:hypothetical protein
LAAAFALGAYVVLAPVGHKTAVATCVLSSLILPYKNLEFIWRRLLLLPPLRTRKGLIWAYIYIYSHGIHLTVTSFNTVGDNEARRFFSNMHQYMMNVLYSGRILIPSL